MELENNLLEMDPPGEEGPLGGAELVREYVWGPGDSWHATPTDELLVYHAEGRVAWWPLQDAGGDVVAVCAPGLSTDTYRARVMAQQRYDAYGQVIAADHIHPHAFLAVGHKGLFYDRLDRGVSDYTATGSIAPPGTGSFGTIETPRLVPFARGLYHVRNRAYIPRGGSMTEVGELGLTATGGMSTPWASLTLSQSGPSLVRRCYRRMDMPVRISSSLATDVISATRASIARRHLIASIRFLWMARVAADRSPCFRAFCDDFALPLDDFGPVDFFHGVFLRADERRDFRTEMLRQ